MKLTKNMRRWLRRLPCNWSDVPWQERDKLERAGLAYPLSVYGYNMTPEPTDAGRKWLEQNPEGGACEGS